MTPEVDQEFWLLVWWALAHPWELVLGIGVANTIVVAVLGERQKDRAERQP